MFGLALLLLLAFPAAAGAGTASVEPYVEPPGIDPFGSCSRYMMCPPDMLVVAAAPGERNVVTITQEPGPEFGRLRFLVRDDGAPVEAGQGCEQVEPGAVACTAATAGPLRLGDGNDSLTAPQGQASGGAGRDLLNLNSGRMKGDGGDDVLNGTEGDGGEGDDILVVTSGEGGAGEDVLRCAAESLCRLDGGAGDDRLTGGDEIDRLFGRAGDDLIQGGGEFDTLLGNRGDDRLAGGAGGDHLRGGRGADRLFSRTDRVLDRVNCGSGRSDRAVVDRRDDVKRCERVLLPPP
jgi:RTX calcium-binding nonapeptide repeat (4 copies)